MARIDAIIEALALAGLAANLVITLVYGTLLPAAVPTHVGPSGGIDAWGSKWVLIGVMTIIPLALFALITLLERYPHVFNYPMPVTVENAPWLYMLGVRLMRWIKLIIAWNFAASAYIFVIVLPANPGASVGTSIIILALSGAMLIPILYYLAKMLAMPQNKKP